MHRTIPWRILTLTLLLLAGGCASSPQRPSTTQPYMLPKDVAQPRLREVLAYLAEHGFDQADNVYLFQFSVWVMYDQLAWEDFLRKPRFESATFDHDDTRITIGVSPVKAYHSNGAEPEKLIPINPEDPAKPHGLSIVLEGRRWSLKYTLDHDNAALAQRLTELLQTYARDFAHRLDTDETLRAQREIPRGQPSLDLQG
ncbi:MAG TPA: hypothetical protein VHP11_16580 [Tepidisphaeraceae bacterium]|nr:hypothetical protein [Tepidisphaeraceae bacterium]